MPDDVVQDATPESSTGYEGYDQIAAQPAQAEPVTPQPAQEPEQVPFHNHPRWQEVNRQLQAYRQYGDPATIQERLSQREAYENYILSQWRQAKSVEQRGRGLDTPSTALSPEDQEVRNKLLQIFPHLQNVERQATEYASQTELQQRTIVARGREVVTGYANSLGIQAPLGHQAIENAITAIIESNEGALERFKGGDHGIVNHAVQALDAYVFEPIRRAAITYYVNSKQRTTSLPRTTGTNPQGIPATINRNKAVADMTPQESLDLEWAILNSDRK